MYRMRLEEGFCRDKQSSDGGHENLWNLTPPKVWCAKTKLLSDFVSSPFGIASGKRLFYLRCRWLSSAHLMNTELSPSSVFLRLLGFLLQQFRLSGGLKSTASGQPVDQGFVLLLCFCMCKEDFTMPETVKVFHSITKSFSVFGQTLAKCHL